MESYHEYDYEAEAEQAEGQTDGQFSGHGHGTFPAVDRTHPTVLRLLTHTVSAN